MSVVSDDKPVKPLFIEIQATAFPPAGRLETRGIAPVSYCHSLCQVITGFKHSDNYSNNFSRTIITRPKLKRTLLSVSNSDNHGDFLLVEIRGVDLLSFTQDCHTHLLALY